MKSSSLLLCLVPAVALAGGPDQVPPAVAPSPSLPNTTPPAPLPNIQSPPEDGSNVQLEARQMIQVANGAAAKPAAATTTEETLTTTVVDQWPTPSSGSIGLGTLTASPGVTKSLRARSEGTLGQTPWIGMAIGLTCTALAAVMLG